MRMSHVAFDRMAEQGAKDHPVLKEQLKRTDIPRLSLGKNMTNEQLFGKLSRYGISFSRESFREVASEYLSAQGLMEHLHEVHHIGASSDQQVDWIWVALAVLWERWLPEQPSLEMIDDRMQKGYEERENKNPIQACEDWVWTWNQMLEIAREQDSHTVAEFDDLCGGTQSLFNWSQDLDTELRNTGLKDPRFLQERIKFAEGFLSQFTDAYFVRKFTVSAAESYFKLGQKEKADDLFEQSLARDPKWGWGWIHWSDCYHFRSFSNPPVPARSEQILKRGLAVSEVEDRLYILERVIEVLNETGRAGESDALKLELENAKIKKSKRQGKETISVAPGRLRNPVAQKSVKVGRNDPCPCGSGKKFKKCHLH